MVMKWTNPVFIKRVKDQLDADIAALPTSAEVSATYVGTGYVDVTFVHSS